MDCSYEVRGVSGPSSCGGSKRDCLLIDDVSVLLLLSANIILCAFVRGGMSAVALPVMSRWNALTSIEARGIFLSCCDDSTSSYACSCDREDRHGSSIVARVLVKGFGGMPGAALPLSTESDIRSVSVLCPSSPLLEMASNGSAAPVTTCFGPNLDRSPGAKSA